MEDTINKLIEALKSKEGFRRQAARKQLVEIGEPAIEYLKELLDSKDHHTRWEAIKAIGEIASIDSIPLLIEYTKDGESDIRWLAAKGLINIGRPSIKPLVSALVEDYRSVFLREATHHVLRYLKSRKLYTDTSGILPALKKFRKVAVIKAAEDLLQKDEF